MLDFDLKKMLFTIPVGQHDVATVTKLLTEHPEIKFVSMVGVDLAGHNTDEKIPIKVFIEDMPKILKDGVQTDGSSVALPDIAELDNARVDILPDDNANWFVEYNFNNRDFATGLPVGTLRIPSFLRHNNDKMVGSRIFMLKTTEAFKTGLLELLKEHPYVFEYIDGVDSVDEIESIELTSATELEFWVKTPGDSGDVDELFTSQELKEQYWIRTVGPVATALEQTIEILDMYGFNVEMGHKEVGGVRAKLGSTGRYEHVMEQLEIDWKFASPMQAADNEAQVKHIVRDVFRMNNLDVTFLAKPMDGVAGNGEHTHLGMAVKLKNGKRANLFAPKYTDKHFMSPVGFGALMGILRNYEILNPFVAPTHDAFQRLKPGFEAPVCIVTSLGHDYQTPSRNRTVLIGLVRDVGNPLAMRFELRAPNPHTNTYLAVGAAYKAMLDGIKAVLEAEKTPEELEASISKKVGEEDFYLETGRQYRSEVNVFEQYTPEEREELFGKSPANVWQNFKAFDTYADKLEIITGDDERLKQLVKSYRTQMMIKWSTEFRDRIIPNDMDIVRSCKPCHDPSIMTGTDVKNWEKVQSLRLELGKTSEDKKSLLTQAVDALDAGDYDLASDLELLIQEKIDELRDAYAIYKRNIF